MARPLKFLHAADFHLGASFIGAQLRDPELGLLLRKAVHQAYDAVITTALDESVDFVCFAGDLFNAAESDYQAQGHFIEGLRRLQENGIEAFLVAGNHDPLDGSDRLSLPENAHLFSTESVEEYLFEKEGAQSCAIYGRSYPQAEVQSNYAQGFKRGNCQNAIALLHTNVGTASVHENYARCSLDDLKNAGMDYWALGHIHLTQVLSESKPCVIYAGSPQALNINETGAHGCYVVEIDNGSVTYDWYETNLVEMKQIVVDISTALSLDDVRTIISHELRENLSSEASYLVRLVLQGVSHLGCALDDYTLSNLHDSLHALLVGPLPRVFLDTTILNETTDSVEEAMAQTNNTFLRAMLDVDPDTLMNEFDLSQAIFVKNNKPLVQIFPEIVDELSRPEELRKMLTEAQELLYRELMQKGN